MLDIDINEPASLAQLSLSEEDIATILNHVLSSQDIQIDCQLSLSIVSDDEIRAINKTWRGVDAPTDVISIECERPGDAHLLPGELVSLGDIFISPSYVKEQVNTYKTSLQAEATLLLVHAMLHLLGYDHEHEEDARVMEALEDTLALEVRDLLKR